MLTGPADWDPEDPPPEELHARALATCARAGVVAVAAALVHLPGGFGSAGEAGRTAACLALPAFALERRAAGALEALLRLAAALALGLLVSALTSAWQRGGGDVDAGAREVALAGLEALRWPGDLAPLGALAFLAAAGPALVRGARSSPRVHLAAWLGAGLIVGTFARTPTPLAGRWLALAGAGAAGLALVHVERRLAAGLPGLAVPPPEPNGPRRLATWGALAALAPALVVDVASSRPPWTHLGSNLPREAEAAGRLRMVHHATVQLQAATWRDGEVRDPPASLHDLDGSGLVPRDVSLGLSWGYSFRFARGPAATGARWVAAADSIRPVLGRSFLIDEDGLVYRVIGDPRPLDPATPLAQQQGLQAVGR